MTVNLPSKTTTTQKTKHLQHEFNPDESNFIALTFPVDPQGVTAKLRQEFRATILRCRGSDEKFQQVLDNLEILMAWAQAKLADDKATNAINAAADAARAAEVERQEAFRARIQAGASIKVSATGTGFIEQHPHDGSVLAVYDTAEDARGPIAAMAQMMLEEGRDPTSTLDIRAFGRQGIGSGRTLQELASSAIGTDNPAAAASGGLMGIRV